jgi:hypothetical protein
MSRLSKYLMSAAIVAAITAVSVHMIGCSDDDAAKQQQVRNRVPTVAEQVTEAQDAAQRAKSSADAAAQTVKDIQAAVSRLDNAGRNSDGSRKVGAPEVTLPGVVTSVGESVSHEGESTTIYTFYFTFADRSGFVKQFIPLCPNQSVPVNNTVTLNFHWHEYTSVSDKGCYQIDGYTVIK